MEKRYVVAGAYPVLSSDSLSEPSAVWVTGKMGALKSPRCEGNEALGGKDND